MKKYLLPLILILLLTFTLGGYSAWLAGWDYRIELSIGDYAGDIGASVTWFPVTIFLKDANGDSTKIFEEIGNNYRKMAITKNDGTTELKGEIEGWNYDAGTPANSTGFIHTSADGWTINANTSVWVYYDNDHADNANIDVVNTAAAEAVWNGNFVMVQHNAGATSAALDDSTSNNNDVTGEVGSPSYQQAGQIGYGVEYGTGKGNTVPSHSSIEFGTGDFTVECYIKTTTNDWARPLYKYPGGDNNGWYLGLDGDELYFKTSAGGSPTTVLVSAVGAHDGNFHYIVGRRNGTTVYTSWDVVNTNSNTDTIRDVTNVGQLLYFNTDSRTFVSDELRLSDTYRSDAWKKGTYNSLEDTLFTYGSEESAPEVEEVNAIFFGTNF